MAEKSDNALSVGLLELLKSDSKVNSEFLVIKESETNPYARLLENFIHLECTEEEAIQHWEKILENAQILKEKLGRNVGIHLAIVDYFTNINQLLSNPILIEIRVYRQTEQLAMIDGLTSVFNRRYMDIVLKKEMYRCERYSKSMSVILMDIDNFKKINDTRGHVFGDHVLKELAIVLKEVVREEDIVCRYGGEEFLLILPETEVEGALFLAERIRLNLKSRQFFSENVITFSGGTATYPGAAKDEEDLLKAADRALYQAKAAGKDRIFAAEADRRKFGRYSHSWDVAIIQKNNNKQIAGIVTQNISLGGIQFECPERYAIDTALHLFFTHLDSTVPQIETEGRITWVKKIQKSYIYGVTFIDITDVFKAALGAQLPSLSKS